MPLHSPGNVPERILSIGAGGTGKSHSWLSIAKRCQGTGSDARFYVVDSDNAIPRMLSEGFPDLRNVVVRSVFDWMEYVEATEEFAKVVRPQDWIVVDMISYAWEAVQEYYTEQVFGKSLDSFFLDQRMKLQHQIEAGKARGAGGDGAGGRGGKGGALDGWRDWSQINKIYGAWVNRLTRRNLCNLYAVAPVEAINDETDGPEMRSVFGVHGVKPKGQKHLAHQFHTVLIHSARKPGEWKVSTAKDRGRGVMEGVLMRDFAVQYLMGVAKWTL